MAIKVIDDKYLADIANAIRLKSGATDTYTPAEMADAIAALTIGSGGTAELPEEAYNIKGNCELRFANNGWTWFIHTYGDKVNTSDIYNCNRMFNFNQTLTHIPFTINCRANTSISLVNMFSQCYKLETVPKFTNCRPSTTYEMFAYCENLKYFPDDFDEGFDWSHFETSYTTDRSGMFKNCLKLRKLPMAFVNHSIKGGESYRSVYYGLAAHCYDLDEIVGLDVLHKEANWTSNAFSDAFDYCYHVKDLTFLLDNGTPKIANWKNQLIDAVYFGTYADAEYAEALPLEKRIVDDATYQLYKNDADGWTTDIAYSRYNHDSAVRTINTLPDCSANGSNNIKFRGASGSKTDGGAISALTEEEIAVAAAKGWTVSIV